MKKQEIQKRAKNLQYKVSEYVKGNTKFTYDQLGFEIEKLIFLAEKDNYEHALGQVHMLFSILNNEKENRNDISFYKLCVKKSKYTYLLVDVLRKNGELTHQVVADILKVSTSQMSNISKIVENLKLVHVDKIGQKKYYSISPRGNELLDYYEENKRSLPKKVLELLGLSDVKGSFVVQQFK